MIDERIRARVARKLQRLDRVVDPEAFASVELSAQASRAAGRTYGAEITLAAGGTTIRSAAAGATLMAAVDAVLDKLERQVVRAKERLRVSRRVPTQTARGGTVAAAPPPSGPGEATEIVELLRVDMEPMFAEDAVTRMDEIGQAFFVFLNAQTGRIGVVYRRAAGGYGLIDPVVPRAKPVSR